MQVTSCKDCGKSDGRYRWKKQRLMQLPLPGRKNVLYGMSLSHRIRKQINYKFIHKIVVEKSPQKFKGFCIMNFCQIGKRSDFCGLSRRADPEWSEVESRHYSVPANEQTLFYGSLPIASARCQVPAGNRPASLPLLPVSLPCHLSKKRSVVITHSDSGSGKA